MTTYTVNNVTEFNTAKGLAASGDTIELNSGVYSSLYVHDHTYTGAGLTITAAAGAQVQLLEVTVLNVSGVTLKNMEFYNDPATSTDFQVQSSSNVVVDNFFIHGSLDNDAAGDGKGMTIRDSSYVTVKNSEFTELYSGLSHVDSDHLTIQGNYLHIIHTDGIRGGVINDANISDINISQNLLTDFRRDDTTHCDAIQFWTTGNTAANTNITVSGNIYIRGEGTGIQGISLFDESGHGYQNVDVTDNFVVGATTQGIALQGVTDALVSGNTLVALPDGGSAISFTDVTNGVLSDNIATDLKGTAAVDTDNTYVSAATDGGVSLLNAWLASHTGLTSLPSEATSVALPPTDLTITGTAYADYLAVAGVQSTRIDGGDGADTLAGGHEANVLVGGAGDDTYVLSGVLSSDSEADDVVIEAVGGGYDTVQVAAASYTAPENIERLDLLSGGAKAFGNALDNVLYGNSADNTLQGGHGNDMLYGQDGDDTLLGGDSASLTLQDPTNTDKGADTLDGGNGADTLSGDYGADSLIGGAGNDHLDGGDGNDTVVGGTGADYMYGRAGADLFVFGQNDLESGVTDTINGFKGSEGDVIDLSAYDTNPTVAGDQAFTLLANNAAFTGAGQVRYHTSDATLQFELNGDGIVDYSIKLVNVSGSPVIGNFVL
jgi:Ca2+-binding RTX toxin-like protein